MPDSVDGKNWDAHWLSLEKKSSAFGKLSAATRRFIFQPSVKYYTDRYFPSSGVFVEMGCGTAHSSVTISRATRLLIGVDYSSAALRIASQSGCFGAVLQADILSLPCRPLSIDGIWNLGVMEHFSEEQLDRCLSEFRRVLKQDGIMILFWPHEGNSSRWILAPLERIKSFLLRRSFNFFPDEISRLRSSDQARRLLERHGFEVLDVEVSWRTAFIHTVVVGRRT